MCILCIISQEYLAGNFCFVFKFLLKFKITFSQDSWVLIYKFKGELFILKTTLPIFISRVAGTLKTTRWWFLPVAGTYTSIYREHCNKATYFKTVWLPLYLRGAIDYFFQDLHILKMQLKVEKILSHAQQFFSYLLLFLLIYMNITLSEKAHTFFIIIIIRVEARWPHS